MVHSGRLGMVVGTAGIVAGGMAMFMLVFEGWLAIAILGGLFVMSIIAATVLLRRADPDQLRRRRDESERFVDAWARGMASASGA